MKGKGGEAGDSMAMEPPRNNIMLSEIVEKLVDRCYVDCVASLARMRERSGSARRREILRLVSACKQRVIRLAIIVEWVQKNVRDELFFTLSHSHA